MEPILIKGRQSIEITGDARVEVEDRAQARIAILPRNGARIGIRAGSRCVLEIFIIRESSGDVSVESSLGHGSSLNSFSLWLGSGKGNVMNSLDGAGARAHDAHVFAACGDDSLSLNTVLRHSAKDTSGDVLVKGIAKDSAVARLEGLIKIGKVGAGAESFLSEQVMLLNPGAHASADPKLEIENNDVSSRHSASVSQIDMGKVFYLMSRGLGEKDAKSLIVEGFLSSAICSIADEKMRETFSGKILSAL